MIQLQSISKGILISIGISVTLIQAQSIADTPKGKAFIDEMAGQYGYSRQDLQALLSQVSLDKAIIRKISKPAEKTIPWYRYRQIFMDKKRIDNGIQFYRRHESVLDEAYATYGVPQAVIVAILGVETRYGKVMGDDKVLTALATIAFGYPVF